MQINLLNHKVKENYTKKDLIVDVIIWVTAILLIVFLFFLSNVWISTVCVQQTSMTNTLDEGDVLILDRLAKPKRQDIIVFSQNDKEDYIKRVIGMEGDTVYTLNGIVYVEYQKDGKTVKEILDEPYIKEPDNKTYLHATGKIDIPRVTLGKGEFFVLGDNRCNSVDSRTYFDSFGNENTQTQSPTYVGIVKQEQIKGVVHQFWVDKKDVTTKIFGSNKEWSLLNF